MSFSISMTMLLCTVVFASGSDIFDQYNHEYFTNQGNPNFDTRNLNRLTNTVGNTTYNWYNRLYNGGCMVTCFAMILANLEATTVESIFDVRDGEESVRDADPVTVMYANTNFAPITQSGTNYISSYTGDPVYIYANRIAQNFGKECHVVDLSGCSSPEKLYRISCYIRSNPEGVITYFYRTEYNETLQRYVNYSHGVVVMESSASLDFGKSIDKSGFPTPYTSDDIAMFANAPLSDRICTESDTIATTDVLIPYVNSRSAGFNEDSITCAQYLTVCDTVNYNSYPGDYVNMCDAYIGVDSGFQFEHITKLYYFD